MFVYLVHHAEAVSPEIDPLRPLSTRGMAQAASVADKARAHGAAPAVVWHSGKARARQTAETCHRTLNPFAEIKAVRGLQPDDDPDDIASVLAAESRDILIASHMPFLPALLHRLTTGRRDHLSAPFPLNGAIALERDGDLWIERWRVSP